MVQKVTVIGQGYVGLPLAIAIAKSGISVIGVDINPKRIETLNAGISPIEDLSDSILKTVINSKLYKATINFEEVASSDVILVCVPTPLSSEHTPDLTYLVQAIKGFSKYIKEGSLIIIESTIEPGTTRNIIKPLIDNDVRKVKYHLAYSPERIDPKNTKWTVTNTPKLVSGLTKEACNLASEFYSNFVHDVIECESPEVAETAKLLENSFRLVNISFINEISMFCQKLGIDVNAVISAAATKPYGFMPFYPSIGVGGHCIPVDPIYLANKAREVGAPTRFIDLADQINQEMPRYFVSRAREKLATLKDKKVLVVGVSYKPNVADVRESPAEFLIKELKQNGAQVFWHDELVNEWNGSKSVALSSDFDLAIIATPHDYLDLTKLGNVPILNTRGSI